MFGEGVKGSLFGGGVKKKADVFTLSPNVEPVHRLMDLNPLTDMPASGDLKSGDNLFFTTPPLEFQRTSPPPPPRQIDPAPNGNDFGHYMKSYMNTYYQNS